MADELVKLRAPQSVAKLSHGIKRVEVVVMDEEVHNLDTNLSGILGQGRRHWLAHSCAVGHQRLLSGRSQTHASSFVLDQFETGVGQHLIHGVVLPHPTFRRRRVSPGLDVWESCEAIVTLNAPVQGSNLCVSCCKQ